MIYEEAVEIIYEYEKWEDISCTCFQGNPPCGKCVDSPSEDEYYEALKIITIMEKNDG